MTIFTSNLKRIFKKRMNRVIIFAAPIVFVVLAFSLITQESKINVGIVDKDNTELTSTFIKDLGKKCNVGIIPEADIKPSIVNKTLNYGIVIEKGFTDNIIDNQGVKIKTYGTDEQNMASAVKVYIENYMSAVKNIAKNTNGNKELFYSSFKNYEKGILNSETIVFQAKSGDAMKERISLGMLGYCMLLIATFSTNIILEDKKSQTYVRMFASPLKNWNYMLQNVLSFFLIVLIQVFIAFGFMVKVFNAQLGASLLNMFLIFAIYAATCVALGLAISSISKNVKQASVLGLLANTLIGMFGGLFWPKEYMPQILLTIGKFTPAYWLTEGVNKLLTSPSLTSAAQDIGVMLLFTVVFFMISSWKKVYVENV